MDRFRAQRGFTLIEALVAILVGVIALLGLYELVDASNKLTKQQTEVADVQQSARIGVSELSRIIRQSRVGGLYFGNAVLPIANNWIPDGTFYTDSKDDSPHYVRKGTDVIEVRGVLQGDKYILDEGNAICSIQNCGAPGARITVTIPWRAALGFVNFPFGGRPSLADKTKPFYFVVQNGENQQVIIGSSTYLVPVYVVGLVDTVNPNLCTPSGTWYTQTPSTFCFTMNPQDTGAKELNATTTLPSSLAKSIAGGPIDVVRFFVDEGPSPATDPPRLDTHPSLVEAILDPSANKGPSDGKWDIQPLVEEAEDFQIAYGVDGVTCPTNPTCYDGGISPAAVDLSGVNTDEWVGNVATELDPLIASMNATDPKRVDAFIDTSVPAGPSNPVRANPALLSVWISLVVKSADPDFVYDGPGARGIKILDSLDPNLFSISAATGRPYRRRPLSLAVSLRNNGLYDRPTPVPTP